MQYQPILLIGNDPSYLLTLSKAYDADVHHLDVEVFNTKFLVEDARRIVKRDPNRTFKLHRLVIINLDTANKTAVTMLLKTLEEPVHTRFVMYTTRPSRVLSTVSSRAHVIYIEGRTDQQLRRDLARVGFTGVPEEILARSYGSERRARALLDASNRRGRVVSIYEIYQHRRPGPVMQAVREATSADVQTLADALGLLNPDLTHPAVDPSISLIYLLTTESRR